MMHRNRYLAALALWSFVASSPAGAQEAESTEETQETTTSTSTAPVTEAPRPIRAPDIVSRATEVTAELQRIEAILGPVDEIQPIETGLPDAALSVAALRSQLEQVDPDHVTIRPLEDHRGRQMLRFGESALEFRLFAWTHIENFLTVSSDLHKAVSAGLASEGIAIAVPRHEVRLSSSSEEGSTANSAKTAEVARRNTHS